jgi:sulfofructose kinase
MTALLSRLRETAGRPFDLLGLGECSIDLVYRVPLRLDQPLPDKTSAQSHEVLGGGQVATACAAAARLGRRARFVGAVGMDGAGQALLSELAADRVDTTGVRRCLGTQTRTALILCGEAGERSVIEWRDAALRLPDDHPPVELVQSCRVLHADLCFPSSSLRAAEQAHEHGLLVSIDLDRPGPGAAELVALADLCVVSAHFPSLLTGIADAQQAALALAAQTAGRVIVTQGERGCWVVQGSLLLRVPAFVPRRLVDTTACGDTFHAALIVGLLDAADAGQSDDEEALLESVRFASAAAALKCSDLGRRGCPRRSEVETFLRDAGGPAPTT